MPDDLTPDNDDFDTMMRLSDLERKFLKLEADQRELSERMENQDKIDKAIIKKAQEQLEESDNDNRKSD